MTHTSVTPSDRRWNGERVLVTGGAGFIGKNLAEELIRLNVGQLVLAGRTDSAEWRARGVEYVTVDLGDSAATASAFNKRSFDAVFHVAGKIDQAVRPGIYAEQFRTHVDATLHLIDGLGPNAIGRFVHIGSSIEYGDAPCPQTPESQELPNSAYGVSKLAATKLVLAKVKSEGLSGVIVRPFTTYGPGMAARSFLASAVTAAVEGKEFPTTAGEQSRDFVSVNHVVRTILAAASNTVLAGTICNACTGIETTVREILTALRQRFPSFAPRFGEIPYSKTELMRSVGVPFIPVTAEAAWKEMHLFFDSFQG